jgi:predicted MFS family arabinose efflux permease
LGSIAFFFFKIPASYAGLGAFLVAGIGMVVGSLAGGRFVRKPELQHE